MAKIRYENIRYDLNLETKRNYKIKIIKDKNNNWVKNVWSIYRGLHALILKSMSEYIN